SRAEMDPYVGIGSLPEFGEVFPDEEACVRYLFKLRWPEGFICECCGGTPFAALKGRASTHECLPCGHPTSITPVTRMHGSQLPLRKWFSAAHLIASHNRTVSARQLQKGLGVASQTAWVLRKKLQPIDIREDYQPLEGLVEVERTEIPLQVSSGFWSPL